MAKKRRTTEVDRLIQGDSSDPLVKKIMIEARTPHIYQHVNNKENHNAR